MGPIPKPPPKIAPDLARNTWITAVGDSITDNMGPWPNQTDSSWLNWACQLAGGLFVPYRPYGIQGATSATILSTALPTILAISPAPAYCVVLAGTNDAGQAVPIATTIANLKAIYGALRARGITPIVGTLPPRNAVGGNTPTIRAAGKLISAWQAQYAADHNYPFVDFHGAMVDSTSSTGSPISGYVISDGVHPTGAGAKAMGQALATLLTKLGSNWAPRLALDNSDTSVSLTNPLLVTDSNSDGTPDNWTLTQGTGTVSLATDAGNVAGNWMVLTKASGTDFTTLRSAAIPVSAGDRMRFAGRLVLSSIAAGAGVVIALGDYSSTSKMFLNATYYTQLSRGPVTFCLDETVPNTNGANAAVWVGITGGTGTVKVGQITVRNLTALGLA